uniref:Uncharacterized protein n=1 Tax=Aegilops tauschii subsp. strangulata TaxID=200361 RepID=A0A453P3R3_AEGTS
HLSSLSASPLLPSAAPAREARPLASILCFPGTLAMAADGSERHTAQVVGADGEMDGPALERFAAAAGLVQRGLSYAVVSIFGPQGSGEP